MPGPFGPGFSLGFGYGAPVVLSSYLSFTQFLLHDPNAVYWSSADVTTAINVARRKVAARAQCIRLLLSGGTITTITLTGGGAGYVSPVVTFTGSGQQASATASQIGGVVQSPITITNGGWGYLTAPTVAITDSGGPGAGATATCTVDNSASTVTGQELYQFSTLNVLATMTPGVRFVFNVFGVAAQWGAGNVYKPTLRERIWGEFQAKRRIWSMAALNYPAEWSRYGQGTSGSFYLFPIPSQQMSMDVDTIVLPVDLVDDTTPELIPPIWTEAVPYYAAYLCYANSQRRDDSQSMLVEYDRLMKEARAETESAMVSNWYSEDDSGG